MSCYWYFYPRGDNGGGGAACAALALHVLQVKFTGAAGALHKCLGTHMCGSSGDLLCCYCGAYK